jgi:SAM-dependent methyltransferase
MRIRADPQTLQEGLRARMLAAVFRDVPDDAFDRCLELGAGEGFTGSLIARYAKTLVSTEIRVGSLRRPPAPNTRYVYCDAELLPFREAKFDLIFSSHLLEHLPDLSSALREMSAALHEDGVMVHLVPSRLWKLLDFGLFFPSQIVHVIEKYTEPREAKAERGSTPRGRPSTVKLSPFGWWRRSFWPPVHGVSRTNLGEILRFGVPRWRAEFERAGLEVAKIRRRLPLHSPYRFGFERTRRLLESLGASSTVGFVMTRRGLRPRRAELFVRSEVA